MKIVCIIPARYASNRLPGKPLADIGGKPMVRHVYERARAAQKIDEVLIATDDERVLKTVQKFGGRAVMTDAGLPSGTDRVYAAIRERNDIDIVINLQGDEPFIEADLLDSLCRVFEHDKTVQIVTPVTRLTDYKELRNPNTVKVTRAKNGYALYFSRAAIPFVRDERESDNHVFYGHIGIYAYRKECLAQLTQLQQGSLEQAEKLEQLRFLENGFSIYTLETTYKAQGVDTAEDLKRVNQIIQKKVS